MAARGGRRGRRLSAGEVGRHALALLVLAGAGCERAAAPVADAGAPAERAPAAGSARTGVEIPMPPGWTALLGPDQSFQAGPPGAPVLRIDRRAHAAEQRPSAEALQEGLTSSLHTARLENVKEEEEEALALLFFDVVAPGPDGGRGRVQPGMLGAKAVGDDLFLCASLPGASSEDVRAAAKACRDLTVRAADSLPKPP